MFKLMSAFVEISREPESAQSRVVGCACEGRGMDQRHQRGRWRGIDRPAWACGCRRRGDGCGPLQGHAGRRRSQRIAQQGLGGLRARSEGDHQRSRRDGREVWHVETDVRRHGDRGRHPGAGAIGGLANGPAAEFGAKIAKMADDLVSFADVAGGMPEAMRSITSGLRGESEPMSRFGVIMQEDQVKAEALRMGIAKLGKELTQQQKFAARASLLETGLAKAKGDHERTGGSVKNRQARTWRPDLERFDRRWPGRAPGLGRGR